MGLEGVKERNDKKGRESNENECVYTDIQRPFRLKEMNSLCEGLKAFKQTEERNLFRKKNKKSWTQYLERATDR